MPEIQVSPIEFLQPIKFGVTPDREVQVSIRTLIIDALEKGGQGIPKHVPRAIAGDIATIHLCNPFDISCNRTVHVHQGAHVLEITHYLDLAKPLFFAAEYKTALAAPRMNKVWHHVRGIVGKDSIGYRSRFGR